MKRILAMVLSLAIVAGLAITGTVAYLQDTDGEVNVMTMGNVFIEQYEQERVSETDSTLQTFTQGQQIVPLVGNDGSKGTMNINGYDIPNVRNLSDAKNYVDKIVSVKNTGTAGAYVRTIFAFPEAGDFDTTYNSSEQWFHWNGSSDTDTTPKNNGWMWGRDKSEWPGNTDNWDVVENVEITVNGEARTYDIYVATNKNIIEAGETTSPSLLGFFVDKRVDNEKDESGNIYYTFTTSDGKEYNLGDITDLNVLVLSQAVQADGFADAWTALDTAFGDPRAENADDPTKKNIEVWLSEVEGSTEVVNDEAGLKGAIENGKSIVLTEDTKLTADVAVPEGQSIVLASASDATLDLDGKTITGNVPKSSGHVIKNAGNTSIIGGTVASTANNGGSAIYNSGTMTVEEATLTGAPHEGESWPSYTVNNYGDMTIKDTTVTSTHGGIASSSGGTVTLENVNVTTSGFGGSSHVFYLSGAGSKLVVNSGTYTHKGNGDGSIAYVSSGTSLEINGGTFTAEGNAYGIAVLGNVTINGGTINNKPQMWGGTLTINGGTFSFDPSTINGATINGTATNNGNGTWTVSPATT